jgi:hypothetical protein
MSMIEEAMKISAEEKHKERLLTLAAAMLTGETAPSDQIINQVLLFAKVIVEKIEAGVL